MFGGLSVDAETGGYSCADRPLSGLIERASGGTHVRPNRAGSKGRRCPSPRTALRKGTVHKF